MRNIWNKYTRSLVIVLFAGLLSYLAFYLNQTYITSQIETKRIVVSSDHIPPYSNVSELLTYREVIASEVPQDAIYNLEELKETGPWFTDNIGLTKGYPVKKSMITQAAQSVFGPSTELEGLEKRFIGVATDQVRSAGDYIRSGVYVDAYVFIPGSLDIPDEVISPLENPRLGKLLVYDRQTSEGKDPSSSDGRSAIPSVAILQVDPLVAKDLVQYQEIGKIYLLPLGHDKNFYLKEKKEE